MEYVEVGAELLRLEQALDWGRLHQLSDMAQIFDDLKLYRDCWGTLKFCSATANPEVDRLDMDSCHSCDGKPIKVWPYMAMDHDVRIYSDPPFFIVADQNQRGFGEIPREGWNGVLTDAGLSRSVIQRVGDHLRQHPPISYFEDEANDQVGSTSEGTPGIGGAPQAQS